MFAWARKDRLSQRCATSSSANTDLSSRFSSQPQSPARSDFNSQCSQRFDSEKKKIKILLRRTDSKQKHLKLTTAFQDNFSKEDLINVVSTKIEKEKMAIVKTQTISDNFYTLVDRKKHLKIKIQVNQLLDQFSRNLKLITKKQWNLLAFASLLVKLGFLKDLMAEYTIVQEIWAVLNAPDYLGTYVFLEQVLENKIHVDIAIKSLCSELGLQKESLNRENALEIIQKKTGGPWHYSLRINRLSRGRVSKIE